MHSTFSFLTVAATLCCSLQGFGRNQEEDKTALIASVESITVQILETAPAQIQVDARGMTNTGGWSKPQLRKKSAKDGVYQFEFVAQQPGAIATQVFTKVAASITFPKPADIREVQVIAKSNLKTEKVR